MENTAMHAAIPPTYQQVYFLAASSRSKWKQWVLLVRGRKL